MEAETGKTTQEIEREKQRIYAKKFKEIVSEPRFKMWLRELITTEIKRQNET